MQIVTLHKSQLQTLKEVLNTYEVEVVVRDNYTKSLLCIIIKEKFMINIEENGEFHKVTLG